MELRYLGFEQLQNARVFRFDVVVKGEMTRQAAVTVDMALFLRHHVGIQEGPSLCASKLTADFANSIEGDHILTPEDLQAHSEARSAAERKRIEARRPVGRRPRRDGVFSGPAGADGDE